MIVIRKFDEKDAEQVSGIIRKALVEVNSKDYPEDVIQFMCNQFTAKELLNVQKKETIM